jgi:hypothetical protein
MLSGPQTHKSSNGLGEGDGLGDGDGLGLGEGDGLGLGDGDGDGLGGQSGQLSQSLSVVAVID